MRRARVIKLLALAAAVVILTVVLHSPIATLLTDPLSRLWSLIDSIPQRLIWTALAALGLVIAIALGRRPRQPGQDVTSGGSSPKTEVERLAKLIELSSRSAWARDVLARRLSETAVGLRALREGVQRGQARDELLAGSWPADRNAAAALQPRQPENGGRYAGELARSLDSLERYAREGEL